MESIIVYFILLLGISSLVKWFKQSKQTQSKSAGGAKIPAWSPSGPSPQRPVHSDSQAPDERRERPMSIAERIREEIERAAMEQRVQEPDGRPKPPIREATQEKPKPVAVRKAPMVTRKRAIALSPLALRFDPRSVRQGILFSEILGPPRAERF